MIRSEAVPWVCRDVLACPDASKVCSACIASGRASFFLQAGGALYLLRVKVRAQLSPQGQPRAVALEAAALTDRRILLF